MPKPQKAAQAPEAKPEMRVPVERYFRLARSGLGWEIYDVKVQGDKVLSRSRVCESDIRLIILNKLERLVCEE